MAADLDEVLGLQMRQGQASASKSLRMIARSAPVASFRLARVKLQSRLVSAIGSSVTGPAIAKDKRAHLGVALAVEIFARGGFKRREIVILVFLDVADLDAFIDEREARIGAADIADERRTGHLKSSVVSPSRYC